MKAFSPYMWAFFDWSEMLYSPSTTKKIKFQKESHVKAWILKCLSVEFFFEVFLIVVHPLPYIEYEF